MTAAQQAERESVIGALWGLIGELESIAAGLRSDTSGIGARYCAEAVDRAAGTCRFVRKRLAEMDTTAVTESFAAAHRGGT